MGGAFSVHITSAEADGKCLFQVQDHAGRVLQVLPPQVGETAHGGAVNDPVICGPADLHDVSRDHLIAGAKPGKNLKTEHNQNG